MNTLKLSFRSIYESEFKGQKAGVDKWLIGNLFDRFNRFVFFVMYRQIRRLIFRGREWKVSLITNHPFGKDTTQHPFNSIVKVMYTTTVKEGHDYPKNE